MGIFETLWLGTDILSICTGNPTENIIIFQVYKYGSLLCLIYKDLSSVDRSRIGCMIAQKKEQLFLKLVMMGIMCDYWAIMWDYDVPSLVWYPQYPALQVHNAHPDWERSSSTGLFSCNLVQGVNNPSSYWILRVSKMLK